MISLIPAIDIIDGKCVRLSKGDFAMSKVYNENPIDIAKAFEDTGCNRLHLVDLDGAKSQHIVNYKTLERIALRTNLTIDFGGGIKSDEDLRIAFDSGANMITGGSVAVKEPNLFKKWIETYGTEKIILGADTKDGKIATNGWLENSNKEIIPFIQKYISVGIKYVISTDIEKDGMLQGPAIDLYKNILENIPDIYLIASGGVATINDIISLSNANIPAVIVGKAIYENKITLKDIERINAGEIC